MKNNYAAKLLLDTSRGNLIFLTVLLCLVALIYWVVYATGGIRFVYSHSMYVPIALAALRFGLKGGLLFGLLGGVVLGPFMPIDTTTGEPQRLLNWVYRLLFFTFLGSLVGFLTDLLKKHIREIEWNLRHESVTGELNRYSLVEDIAKQNSGKNSRLYLVHIKNLYDLELVLGYEVRLNVVNSLREILVNELPYQTAFYHPKSNHIALLVSDDIGDQFEYIESELSNKLSREIVFNHIPLVLDYVYGTVDIDAASESPEEEVRKSELTATQASVSNREKQHYSRELEEHSKRNIELLGFFRESLKNEAGLYLQYQPKYDLKTRRITGAEALIRWDHNVLGRVSPGEFVPLVEKSQLINSMTYWVIEEALKDFKQFRESVEGLERVAINISSVNLMQEGFYESVATLLDRYGVDAGCVEFEITEGAIMHDYEYCKKKLALLSDMGSLVSIDDFGTGYSSLQHVASLPVDIIKIDQFFVKHLTREPIFESIVRSTINLAHDLGYTVIAEGIEDRETEEILRDLECDRGQGYYFSKPLAMESLQQNMHSLQAGG